MDEAEKKLIAEFHRRRQAAEPFIEAEKLKSEKNISLIQALKQFDLSFRYSQTLPQRHTSGFVEYYKALSRVR